MFVRDGAVTPGPSRECDITFFAKGRPKSARQSRDSTVAARRVQSVTVPSSREVHLWSAANGGLLNLRDGGLSKSEDIWGKRPFSSVFWISQVLFAHYGKGRKRQKEGEKG